MTQVVALIGVSVRTINRYFPKKGEMILKPTAYNYEDFIKTMLTVMQPLCKQKISNS